MPVSASSARRPCMPRCRRAASSTTISRRATSARTCSERSTRRSKVRGMLDDRVRAVLDRLQAEDADERARGLPLAERSRAVATTTGAVPLRTRRAAVRLRGARDRRAHAATRPCGSPRACAISAVACSRSRRTRRRPRLAREHRRGGARRVGRARSRATPPRRLSSIDDVFDVVFLDAEKDDYERLFQAARPKLEPGALVICRQRALARRDARRVRGGPPGRPDARVGDGPARPRPRAFGRPARRPLRRLIFCG